MRTDQERNLISVMYGGTTDLNSFKWDQMTTVPILSLMTTQDIDYIRKLILSPKYSGDTKYKLDKINDVMHFRGFTKFAGGTNRVVYIHPSAPNAVFKIAIDSIGIGDNPAEYRNQAILKPYCCKVFECSPCGTIASFERVYRITTFKEFYEIADDYFYILSRRILGKYIMEDIGIDYFMNVGIRIGCHPVILDFPYLYELDGKKLQCQNQLDDGTICGGEIDYDDGFNKLICKKCGRIYRAKDLRKDPDKSRIVVIGSGEEEYTDMRNVITAGNRVIRVFEDGLCVYNADNANGMSYEQYMEHMNNANDTEDDSNDYTINTQESEQIEPKEISKSVKAPEPTESEHVVEANFDKVRDIIKSNSSNPEDTIAKIPDEIELAPDEEEVHEESSDSEPETTEEEPRKEYEPPVIEEIDKSDDDHHTVSSEELKEYSCNTKPVTSPLVGNTDNPVEFSNSMMEYMVRKKGSKIDLNNIDLM